jgi:hypothetical protein
LDDTSYSKKSSDHATLDDTSSSTWVLPPNILRMLLPLPKVPSSTDANVIMVKQVHVVSSLYHVILKSVFAHIACIFLLLWSLLCTFPRLWLVYVFVIISYLICFM